MLNRPGDVAPDTLSQVRRVIKELGYVPNPLAQAIASRESHLIGLAVPRFHGEFMTWLLHGADEEANRLGYHLMMTTIAVSDDGHSRRHIVGSNLIDALLVVITETEDHLAHDVVQSGLPTVVIDTDMSGKGLDSVVLDNERGTREAVEHLLRWVEPKSLYFVGGPRTNFDSVERMRAFRAALGEAESAAAGRGRGKENGHDARGPGADAAVRDAAKDGAGSSSREAGRELGVSGEKGMSREIAEDDERVSAGAYSIEWGKEWGIRMIEKLGLGASAGARRNSTPPACIGVLAGNDKIACGIMQAAEDAGVKVPEQLRVVGFNDSHLSRIVRPNLSTVSLPMKELGALAVRHLVRRMEDPKAEVLCTKLPTKLIVRESSTARNF